MPQDFCENFENEHYNISRCLCFAFQNLPVKQLQIDEHRNQPDNCAPAISEEHVKNQNILTDD